MAVDLKILDVSYAQAMIDYEKVAKEVDGVIIRCGRTLWGNFQPGEDSCWEKHYNGFKSAGVPVGAYYYGTAKNASQAKREAEECIKILKGKKLELPVFYDVEEQNTQGNLGRAALTEVVRTFCDTMEDAGYFCGFYTMLSWAQSKLDYKSLATAYSAWIAWTAGDPRTKLSPKPPAHQYTWNAKVNGISSGVDMSHFYTDYKSIITSKGFNGYTKPSKPVIDTKPEKPEEETKPSTPVETPSTPVPPVEPEKPTFQPYTVKVTIKNLRIRKGPGTNYASAGFIAPAIYTIVEEKNGQGASKWGKLKSGAGWISLDYVTKC